MGQRMSASRGDEDARQTIDNLIDNDDNPERVQHARGLFDTSESEDEQLSSNLEDRTFQNILAVLVGRQSLELR